MKLSASSLALDVSVAFWANLARCVAAVAAAGQTDARPAPVNESRSEVLLLLVAMKFDI